MPWFQCQINGENFPGSLIGESEDIGFYVTRYVESQNCQQAEYTALEKLKSEPKLMVAETKPKPIHAQVHFESVVEIPLEQVPETQPGFCFFVMGS